MSTDSNFSEDNEKSMAETITNTEQEVFKPLTPAKLAEFKKAQDNTGIIYLSRIPPFMKPSKIKHLMGKFGDVGKIYLAPEGMFQKIMGVYMLCIVILKVLKVYLYFRS